MLPSIQVGGHPEGLAAREFVGGPTPSIPASRRRLSSKNREGEARLEAVRDRQRGYAN